MYSPSLCPLPPPSPPDYFYHWGSLLRIESKVDITAWSVYIREAQVELAGTVLKALGFSSQSSE